MKTREREKTEKTEKKEKIEISLISQFFSGSLNFLSLLSFSLPSTFLPQFNSQDPYRFPSFPQYFLLHPDTKYH